MNKAGNSNIEYCRKIEHPPCRNCLCPDSIASPYLTSEKDLITQGKYFFTQGKYLAITQQILGLMCTCTLINTLIISNCGIKNLSHYLLNE